MFLFGFYYIWMYLFFFFKQKTAYEMRISDWSSDVCSSDLHATAKRAHRWHQMSSVKRKRDGRDWLIGRDAAPAAPVAVATCRSRSPAPLHFLDPPPGRLHGASASWHPGSRPRASLVSGI